MLAHPFSTSMKLTRCFFYGALTGAGDMVLAMLAAVLLFGLIVGPPLVARTMRNREGPQT